MQFISGAPGGSSVAQQIRINPVSIGNISRHHGQARDALRI
jgi:hypothetical protein